MAQIPQIDYTMEGRLHSVETMGLVDGPGIRTIFFLQGCPLRCAYCHNPDSQDLYGAGKTITVEEVRKLSVRYKPYYGYEGGVTFSGGEPLLQGEFIYNCIRALNREGINVCIDTSGFGDPRYYAKILPLVDTLLLDVKHFQKDKFYDLVKGSLDRYYKFLTSLKSFGFTGEIYIRHVMIPGYTDNEESMRQLVDFIEPIEELIKTIEILPYHTMGVDKYAELGMEYRLKGIPPMQRERAKELESFARKYLHKKRSSKMPEKLTKDQIDFDLRDIPLLAGLVDKEFKRLESGIQIYHYNKGEIVFSTGDEAKRFFIICSGSIKIYENTPEGREQILYIYHAGDFVGGLNVLKDHNYLYVGQALEECIIVTMNKEVFDLYALTSPLILRRILEKCYDRIRWAESLIQRLSSSNATIKVAALLLQLANDYGETTPDGLRLELPINREEMGSYAGLTRETMTRKLQELREQEVISFDGPKVIWIHDRDRLRMYTLG